MHTGRVISTLGAITDGLCRNPDGTTISVRAKRPLDSVDGYVVGGGFRELVLPAATPPNFLAIPAAYGALVGWLVDLPVDTTHVGVWLHDGMYYFDSVTIYTERALALSVAESRNEIAIWDGIKQCEIPVAEPQY